MQFGLITLDALRPLDNCSDIREIPAMNLPPTSEGAADNEIRLNDKLERSPGSFFKARVRSLVLAARYANDRIQEDATYSATRVRHHHTVCGATYAMILSSFELTWKSLYARIIDATTDYDSGIVADKLELDTESILAHRDTSGAGAVLASTITWQRARIVNERFKAAFNVEPLDRRHHSVLDQLWQIRHVIAHSSGVVSELDSYRMHGAISPRRALQIDDEYLEATERTLIPIVEEGVDRVGKRLLSGFFGREPAPTWENDQAEFSRLALLKTVVSQTKDLPEVTATDFTNERHTTQPEARLPLE